MPELEDIVELKQTPLLMEMPLYVGNRKIVDMWHHLSDDESIPPPYWLYPWVGGQALARYTLDNPKEFYGKNVFDFGPGTGINSIAAGMAGAASVTAVDTIPQSLALTEMNWDLHALPSIGLHTTSHMPDSFVGYDVILLGDSFYDLMLSEYIKTFAYKAIDDGVRVLLGDPGREYLPRRLVKRLAKYTVDGTLNLEKRVSMPTYAFELMSNSE